MIYFLTWNSWNNFFYSFSFHSVSNCVKKNICKYRLSCFCCLNFQFFLCFEKYSVRVFLHLEKCEATTTTKNSLCFDCQKFTWGLISTSNIFSKILKMCTVYLQESSIRQKHEVEHDSVHVSTTHVIHKSQVIFLPKCSRFWGEFPFDFLAVVSEQNPTLYRMFQ